MYTVTVTENTTNKSAIAVTKPQDPNYAHVVMSRYWRLIDALKGGTDEIRKRRTEFLPQEPRESDDAYSNRLNRSVLSPYLPRLVQLVTGLVLRKEIILDDVSDRTKTDMENVNLLGDNLSVFAKDLLETAVYYGHAGILVDFPEGSEDIVTLADERAANRRPYWKIFEPKDILGWRSQVIGGVEALTQLRLKEYLTEPDGDFGEKCLNRIRVLEPGNWKLYTQKDEGGEYAIETEGTTSLDYIPFSICYAGKKIKLLESKPPLLDVAYLNLKHYQVQSDLDWMLHISAVPMLAFFGFPPTVDDVSVGPNEAINFPENGRAQYVEPSGSSFAAQNERLAKIEHEISTLSISAIANQKMAAETAMAKRIDRAQGDSGLNTIAQGLEDCLDNCLKYHADFYNEPDKGTAHVNRDFIAAGLEPAEVNAYMQLWLSQAITQKTLLEILADGDVFAGVEDFDPETEIEMTQQAFVDKSQQQMDLQAEQMRQQAEIAQETQPQEAE